MAPVTGQVGRKRGPGDLRASGLSDPRCLIAFSTENHSTDRSNVKRYWSFACSNFSRDPVRYSERLKGFQRPMTVQEPSQSPVIYSKQRCRSVVVLILQL
ncbi:hypothetical protein PC112_g17904 [Phytophthora cactorum]|nr:hypothetical protein PC112_g17904 [Phytophthora cactorum]